MGRFLEESGIFYVDPAIVLPGFQVGGQALEYVFGVGEYSDWLVWGDDFQCCDDRCDFADLVGLGFPGDS